jgi:hypothetical protein
MENSIIIKNVFQMIIRSCCVKAKQLRAIGYTDLRDWISDNDNVLATRKGRIFIDGKIFHYPQSKWANVGKMSMSDYAQYIRDNLWNDLDELSDKMIGCFCVAASLPTPKLEDCMCHTQVLRILGAKY